MFYKLCKQRDTIDVHCFILVPQVIKQLSDYRTKREQGLGNMFGNEKLPENWVPPDPQKEAKLVDDIVGPTFEAIDRSLT